MIDEVTAGGAMLRWRRIGAATTADDVRALEAELLGKKGPFADVQDPARRAGDGRREEGGRPGGQRGDDGGVGGRSTQRSARARSAPSARCSSRPSGSTSPR